MSPRLSRAAGIAVAVVVISVVWTAFAFWIAPLVTPTIPEVMKQMWTDRFFYIPHVETTLTEAAWGWVWGNLAAVMMGSLIVMSGPIVSSVIEKFSVAMYAVPLLAIGPILQIVTAGRTTKIALAAMAVFFTTTVLWTLGLRSADPAILDVVHTAGGGEWTMFARIRVHAALPELFAGLQIAAPAAVLGAIVGEYLGGTRGLGVAMIQSQSSFAVARTWGLAIVIAVIVGVIYAITGRIGRTLTPWASRNSHIPLVQFGSSRASSRILRIVVGGATGALLIGLWWGLLEGFQLDRYFASRPSDVIDFFTSPLESEDRALLFSAARQTTIDTGVGFVVGLLGALFVANAINLSRLVDSVVTPVAIALRSLPIIAMTPLIALVFGRGIGAVTVIVGLVTFFPTLIAVSTALRNAPVGACEVVAANGGSQLQQLRLVRIPFAAPALFSAAKIALPGAIGGALLAEWLATGAGLGSLMLRASASSRFALVWSASVVVVIASLVGYAFVGVLENAVARRFGIDTGWTS